MGAGQNELTGAAGNGRSKEVWSQHEVKEVKNNNNEPVVAKSGFAAADGDGENKKKKKKKFREVNIKYPEYIGSTLTSILVFVMAASMRGKTQPT